jgi:hypothetical protein
MVGCGRIQPFRSNNSLYSCFYRNFLVGILRLPTEIVPRDSPNLNPPQSDVEANIDIEEQNVVKTVNYVNYEVM